MGGILSLSLFLALSLSLSLSCSLSLSVSPSFSLSLSPSLSLALRSSKAKMKSSSGQKGEGKVPAFSFQPDLTRHAKRNDTKRKVSHRTYARTKETKRFQVRGGLPAAVSLPPPFDTPTSAICIHQLVFFDCLYTRAFCPV